MDLERRKKEKILLMLLPYWTPMIPPMGISILKTFLEKHDYEVFTVDANTEIEVRDVYREYLKNLKKIVPEDNRGNFYNISNEVMRNHLMATINKTDEAEYEEAIKIIFYKTFYIDIVKEELESMNLMANNIIKELKSFIISLVEEKKPDVVGISVFRDNMAVSLFAFQLIKKINPNIRTIMGGGIFANELTIGSPNYEYFMEKTTYIDNVIIGEGQNIFLKLLKNEFEEKKKVYTIEDINNEMIDLKNVDVPDLSDFNLSNYPLLPIQASVSCPYKCSFCNVAVYWGEYRKKEAKQTVSEMEKLYIKYKCQGFFLCEELLNPIIDDISTEIIEQGHSLYYDGHFKVDDAAGDMEKTLFWRKGGFYRARIGVESGSQKILDLIDKKITIEQTKKAIKSLASAGIKTTTFWIVGHPEETEEDFQQTLDLLEELKDYIYEAESNVIRYSYDGQAHSDKWKGKGELLYPEKFSDLLFAKTWYLETDPSREEGYKRMNRLEAHCKKLGIPNPYTLHEVKKADDRWNKLHKNAVPSLIDIRDPDIFINDNRHIDLIANAAKKVCDDGDFNF